MGVDLEKLSFLGVDSDIENIVTYIDDYLNLRKRADVELSVTKDFINLLNESIGKDVDKLKDFLKETEDTIYSSNSHYASLIDSLISAIENACEQISIKQDELKAQMITVDEHLSELQPHVDSFLEHKNNIVRLNINLAYLKAIHNSEFLSYNIATCLESNDLEKAIDSYLSLSEILHTLLQSNCQHLNQYLNDTIHYWNSTLKNQLSREFAVIMKNVQWPLVSSNSILTVPEPDAMCQFESFVEHLLLIQLPLDAQKKSSVSSTTVVNFPVISLPMSLLIHPLRKRFYFHFTGNRKTNRLDKPEWYFSQILTWINDHESFVTKWIQPVYNDLGINRSATLELMAGLVEVCLEKLQNDLEEAQYDDALFSHLVDEALGFHKELTDTYPYPPSVPSTPAVLTQAPIFVKWLNMERKYASDKMDSILSSDTAWCYVSIDDQVTEVGHSFLAMLSAITDRFSSLPQPGHRLQFVEVELRLIDDLRVSLLQLLHAERMDPLNSRLPDILNTVHYLHSTLQQWDISPSMLLLNHYKNQFEKSGNVEDVSEGGVFEESLSLLLRLQDDLVQTLIDAVMLEVKAKSRPYRKDNWTGMEKEDMEGTTLTSSACSMYQVLADKLHQMNTKLAPNLFQQLWKSVATSLNTYLFEELLLENAFSRYGGKVLERDVMKCLLPLFQQYAPSSHSHFAMLKEACSILSLANIPLPLKKAAIIGNNFDLFRSLPFEIKHLSPQQISLVIKRRSDTVTQLM